MNALEIQNLHKTYTDKKGEKIAVDDVNLTVKQGEFFGLLGQNGAGNQR